MQAQAADKPLPVHMQPRGCRGGLSLVEGTGLLDRSLGTKPAAFDRDVAVCPAFAICNQCVLGSVNRNTIHFNSLQCCDLLHADAVIPCCQYGLC